MSSSSSVTQQRKVALIIGNQNYQQLPKLQVTLNDGEAVNELFKKLGFETHLFLDLTKKQMKSEIDEFGEEIIQKNDLVFFYYSGHGGQQSIDHAVHNMLCGIDATTYQDGVSLTTILRRYFYKQAIYFIILDACRTFPKAERMTKGEAGSSTMQETPQFTLAMAEIPQGKEVEILFACQPDMGAFEEEEEEKKLGHLARALQDAVKNVDRWDDVNKYIIRQVREETDNRQTPVVQSSITQPLYIRQVNTQPPQSDPTEPPNLNIPSSSVAMAPVRPSQIDMTIQDALQIFKVQGKLENANIKLTDSLFKKYPRFLLGVKQYIEFEYLGKSLSFKNVTFEYPKKTRLPTYIQLDVARGQQVKVENCSFQGVGLWVTGSADASITNSTFIDIKQYGMWFYNTRSVWMSKVGFKNCERAAVCCDQVREFVGKRIDIQNSDIGFWFYQCRKAQLKLHDVNIQNCKNPIELNESDNVKQHNVNIIS